MLKFTILQSKHSLCRKPQNPNSSTAPIPIPSNLQLPQKSIFHNFSNISNSSQLFLRFCPIFSFNLPFRFVSCSKLVVSAHQILVMPPVPIIIIFQFFVTPMQPSYQQQESSDFEPHLVRAKQRFYNRWTLQENQQYIGFLAAANDDFEKESSRRATKVFKRLSQYMGSKSESQCKSHHQKMMQQYGSIQEIISHFTEQLNMPQNDAKNTQIRKQQKKKIQTRRTIKRVFKNIFHAFVEREQKSIMREMATMRLFFWLDHTMGLTQPIAKSATEKEQIDREKERERWEDRSVFQEIGVRDNQRRDLSMQEGQLYDVLNLNSVMMMF